MIKQVSSQDLMNTLYEAMDDIGSLKGNVLTMKTNLDSRLAVIRNAQEYEQSQLEQIRLKVADGVYPTLKRKLVLARSSIAGGLYDTFGSTFHPQFLKTPSQVFNFNTTAGYVFKDNVSVSINGTEKSKYKGCLYHDSIPAQEICFDEFTTNRVTMEITINSGNLLGATEFSCIEFMPWIPGSVSIENIDIYTMQNYKTKDPSATTMIPDISVPNTTIPGIGNYRFMLDRKYNLYKIVMTFILTFKNSNGKYPFGMKHIYFLNADYNVNSYMVVKVDQGQYIDTISEKVTIVDQTGTVESTCTAEGMVLYVNYMNGIGDTEIVTSKGNSDNPLAHDTKIFYVYYPLQRSITSIEFQNITAR